MNKYKNNKNNIIIFFFKSTIFTTSYNDFHFLVTKPATSKESYANNIGRHNSITFISSTWKEMMKCKSDHDGIWTQKVNNVWPISSHFAGGDKDSAIKSRTLPLIITSFSYDALRFHTPLLIIILLQLLSLQLLILLQPLLLLPLLIMMTVMLMLKLLLLPIVTTSTMIIMMMTLKKL